MPPAALALALAAALVHAGWNLLLARTDDPRVVGSLAFAVAAVAFAPVAAARWSVDAQAVPYLLASNALEIAYLVLLTTAYTRADLSVVYPLARGLAPVLVLGAGVSFLGDSPGRLGALGVATIAAGVVLVRGLRPPGDSWGAGFGLAIAGCVAGYTLVDKRGLEHADTVPYLELVMVGPAVVGTAWVVRTRGRRALRAALTLPALSVAAGSLGAFLLALLALRRADAAAVAAVRETSIVIAAVLAPAVLGERVTRTRLAGVGLVAAGVSLLALA